MRKCGYCGRKNADNATACRECGTRFDVEADSSATRNWRADFDRVGRFLWALNLRRTAFLWAGLHLFLSMVVAAFCSYVAFGEALSDAYHPDPPILKIAMAILVVLQAPAFLAHWFLVKAGLMQTTWRPFTAVILGISCSALLGFMLWLIGYKVEKCRSF